MLCSAPFVPAQEVLPQASSFARLRALRWVGRRQRAQGRQSCHACSARAMRSVHGRSPIALRPPTSLSPLAPACTFTPPPSTNCLTRTYAPASPLHGAGLRHSSEHSCSTCLLLQMLFSIAAQQLQSQQPPCLGPPPPAPATHTAPTAHRLHLACCRWLTAPAAAASAATSGAATSS